MPGGRQRDAVWRYFERLEAKRTGHKARCRKCDLVMHAIVERMKRHQEKCGGQPASADCDGNQESFSDITTKSEPLIFQPLNKRKRSIQEFVVEQSTPTKEDIDHAVASMIYATNSSFGLVEHPAFIRMLQLLRPGYKPPTCEEISGDLLDALYNKNQEACRQKLKEETVSMSLDGWSNGPNEPVISVAVTDRQGNTYVTDTVDTSGKPRTAADLEALVKESIQKTEEKYACKVGTVVTDSAENPGLTSAGDGSSPAIAYGCAAHQMNLLAKDLAIPEVCEHVIAVAEYFQNTDQPAVRLKEGGGTKLPVPSDARWNSKADTVEAYMQNWPILLNVVETYPDEIETEIASKVQDVDIARKCQDYLNRLKPIMKALYKLQYANTTMADSVEVWKNLLDQLNKILPRADRRKVESRMVANLTAAHLLANVLHPAYKGSRLALSEMESALKYCMTNYPDCLPTVLNYQAKAGCFTEFRFSESIVSNVSPITWWRSIPGIGPSALDLVQRLHTGQGSTVSLERICSACGLVYSGCRKRLGIEKTAKIAFLHRILNSLDSI